MKNILLLWGILISSCSQSSFHPLEVDIAPEKIVHQIDSVIIPLGNMALDNYILNHLTRIGENDFFFGYNNKNHSIDIFDLTSEKQFKQINLEHIGPNRIERAEGLFVQSFDSIFVYSYGYLDHIDTTGKIIKKHHLKGEGLFKEIAEGDLTASFDFNIVYFPKEHSCLFYYKPHSLPYLSQDYLEQPFASKLYLERDSLVLLPVNFSRYYIENNGKFGWLTEPNVSVYKNELIYNFPAEPNIYIYDLQTGEHHVYGGKSRSTNYIAKPIEGLESSEELENHFLKSHYFFKTIYDPYRNLYYRLHWGSVDPAQYDSPYAHKPVYLMVFNERMQLLKELKLNDFTYIIECWFVMRKGLYLNLAHPLNKNRDLESLSFHIFKFENES